MANASSSSTENPGVGAVPADPAANRVLFILADDHRNSLERGLYGLTGDPTLMQAARISADKLLVYQALLDAVEVLPAIAQPSILVDEQYGASVAELAARSGGRLSLCMPIEASGEEWFQFAYGEEWQRHAEFFTTDHAKVLVRDNPGLDPNHRDEQARRLAQVSTWAAAANHSLILELLVPPTDADTQAMAEQHKVFDDALRPTYTVQVIEYLQDHGVEPAIWKVEGLDHQSDAVALVNAARRGGRQADCIVLGRHAPHEKLDQWLRVAAPIPGYIGFAIGRSIWWDALLAHLRRHCTADEARRRIRDAYLGFTSYYLERRTGAVAGPVTGSA
jgi:myo-inositol catabolism protein IolC